MAEWSGWQRSYAFGMCVIWLPELVRGTVNVLRQRYDPASQAICEAHITLTQPFLRQPQKDDLELLARIAADFAPFEIHYGPLNSFFPYPCIWLEVRPVKQILSLRRALHNTGLFDLSLPHTDDFVPHMTITEGLSGPEVNHELLESMRPEVAGGSFTCTGFVHIVPDPNFHFEVQRTFPFSTVKPA